MKSAFPFLALAVCFALGAAESVRPGPESVAQALEQGKAVAHKTFGVLSGNLSRAMNEGGPTNAVRFCSENVAGITGGIARTNNVRLQRLSHRARNPSNRATGVDLTILENFRASPVPVVRTNSAGRFVFFAPITINNPFCLKCHGEPGREMDSETQALIRTLYPEDAATGFRFGELRGLWKIEFLP